MLKSKDVVFKILYNGRWYKRGKQVDFKKFRKENKVNQQK